MMRRALKFSGLLVVGWAAIWVVLFSPALFLVAVVIGLAVWLVVVMDQRDNAAANWADEVFKVASLRHANAQLAGDYDAAVKRLAEVLDDHALCPTPVRVEITAVDRFTERMVGVARAASVIPLQRDGCDS